MQSEIDLLRQRITELEARKAELEIENAEISELRKKLAELEARNVELIKQIVEDNNRRDAKIEDTTDRVAKLEQKQLQNDNTPSNNSSNFNFHDKPLEDRKMGKPGDNKVFDDIDFGLDDEILDGKPALPVDSNHPINARTEGISVQA
ncbi:hypothetical protein C1646_771270 [Rhizophagus diaphanus]|nr:hypothetical protein C1646_771270 [Rhizophagus diaphanus] [Rhizophagus sp. MUCL 43196]